MTVSYQKPLFVVLIATIIFLLLISRMESYGPRVCESLQSQVNISTKSPLDQRFKNVSGNPGDQIPCDKLLKLIEPSFSAMLIDTDLMGEIINKTCHIPSKPINVAVSVGLYFDMNSREYPEYELVFLEDSTSMNYLKFFGKVKRGIPRIETTRQGKWILPKNMALFKEFWKRSRLLECQGVDMKRNESETSLPLPYAVEALAQLRDLLVSYGMYPFLVEGSFLGWYRECGIITHTHDMDFGVLIEENNPKLLKALEKKETDFKISRKFGKPESGYEFTIKPKLDNFPIDLFFMYNNGVNESWIGGTDGNGQKYQFVFPLNFDPFCAAELFGQLFWISCHPETIILKEYGAEWRKDHLTSEFSWHSSQKNSRKADKWSSKEMEEVYILY